MIGRRTNKPTLEEQLKQAARTAFTAGYVKGAEYNTSTLGEKWDPESVNVLHRVLYKHFEEYWSKQNK